MSDPVAIQYWTPTATRLAREKRLRAASYEASLTLDQRIQLYARILANDPVDQVHQDAATWPDGSRPALTVFYSIAEWIRGAVAMDQRLQRLISEMETTAQLVQSLRNQCAPAQNRDRLDAVIGLMGDAAVQMAAGGQVDKTLIGVASLLLKRQDQVDEKAKFDESMASDLDRALKAITEEMRDTPEALALVKQGLEIFRAQKAA